MLAAELRAEARQVLDSRDLKRLVQPLQSPDRGLPAALSINSQARNLRGLECVRQKSNTLRASEAGVDYPSRTARKISIFSISKNYNLLLERFRPAAWCGSGEEIRKGEADPGPDVPVLSDRHYAQMYLLASGLFCRYACLEVPRYLDLNISWHRVATFHRVCDGRIAQHA